MNPQHLCEFCGGAGREFSQEDGPVNCLLCGGSGLATLAGDLGPTHSEPARPFTYTPAQRALGIGLGARAKHYLVTEFVPEGDFEGRAFRLIKRDWSGHYSCLIGGPAPSCDCAGSTFLNTAKANLRSWLRDDKEFPSLGCKHLDALKVLLEDGWLDLPEHVPTYPNDED
jgi:hypothetical protein